MGQKIPNEYTTPGLLNLNRLCILDTETGGEDPNDYSILSIACVIWEAGQELDSREWFICERPEPIVKQSALDVNHIDYNWIVENGLPPVEAFADFEAFLTKWFGGVHFNNSIRLLGHNLPFDIRFLKRFLHHAEVYKRGYAWFDQRFQRNHIDTLTHVLNTIEAYKLPYPSEKLPNLKLGTCLKYFGVEEENTHEALADAKATGQLYTKLLQQMNPNYPDLPKPKRKRKVK